MMMLTKPGPAEWVKAQLDPEPLRCAELVMRRKGVPWRVPCGRVVSKATIFVLNGAPAQHIALCGVHRKQWVQFLGVKP